MKEIIAYEMSFDGTPEPPADVLCVPFQKKYWNAYMQIYNECFYEMRKDLEIEPYDFYSDSSQMKDKTDQTFLYLRDGIIIGAVSCYGNAKHPPCQSAKLSRHRNLTFVLFYFVLHSTIILYYKLNPFINTK